MQEHWAREHRPKFHAHEELYSKTVHWDVFISHASEDKEAVARPLAILLQNAGNHVWLDANTLTIGDSLSQKIDHGLANSRYGVIILSKNFFAKGWPQRELNGLVQREMQGQKVILPVWHGVDHGYVMQFSPTLADKLAITTQNGLQPVSEAILQVLRNDYTQTNPAPTDVAQVPKTILPTATAAHRQRRTALFSITVLTLLLGMLFVGARLLLLAPSDKKTPDRQQPIQAPQEKSTNDQHKQPPANTAPATGETRVQTPKTTPQGAPARIQPNVETASSALPLPPASLRPSQCHIAAVTFSPTSFGKGTLTVNFTTPLANFAGDVLAPDRITTMMDGSTRVISCHTPRLMTASSITEECATTPPPSLLGDNFAVCFNKISLQIPNGGTLTKDTICGSASTDWGVFGRDPNDSQAVLLVRLDASFRSACDEAFNLCIAARTVDGQERQDCKDVYNTPGLIHRVSLLEPSAHTFVRMRNRSTGALFIDKEVSPELGKSINVTLSAR